MVEEVGGLDSYKDQIGVRIGDPVFFRFPPLPPPTLKRKKKNGKTVEVPFFLFSLFLCFFVSLFLCYCSVFFVLFQEHFSNLSLSPKWCTESEEEIFWEYLGERKAVPVAEQPAEVLRIKERINGRGEGKTGKQRDSPRIVLFLLLNIFFFFFSGDEPFPFC